MADGRIIIDTEVDSKGAEGGIKSLGGKLGSLAKTGAIAIGGLVTAASVAVTGLTTLAVKQYAEYEQLVGGVETLFKNSSDKVMDYANNAYKSAGMSANEYMNTITGFAASLLQGLGGDTEKAAQIGNLAVEDMADNANKMGTAIENIQNAYQGFAKQNYTMLDNLKLGYGGTKEEMLRLLADAEKLTGIKYEISNFSDIIEAIHAIQDEMGITGTTAKEAASTIEGSLNMTKAAWTNLLTGMADDNADFDVLVQNLVDSLSAFGDNILPRIKVALNGIGQLVSRLAEELPKVINELLPVIMESAIEVLGSFGSSIIESLPAVIETGRQVVQSLLVGIINNMPSIANGAVKAITAFMDAFLLTLPLILKLGLQAIIELGKGIAQSIPTLLPTIMEVVLTMADMIIENLPIIVDTAIEIIMALVQGLIEYLPMLIEEVPKIINSFSNAIYAQLPKILKAGIDIIIMLVKGLIDSIPIIIANLPQIIMAIINVFTLVNWASIGKNLVSGIGTGIKSMFSNIGSIAKDLGSGVVNAIKGIFTAGGSIGSNLISAISSGISSMLSGIVNIARGLGTSVINSLKNILGWDSAASIGSNLIRGIWNGISNMSGWIINLIGGFAGSVIKSIKGFFGIHSPSRIMRDLIGVNLVKGIGVGIDVETPNLEKDIDANMLDLVAKMKGVVDYETAMTTARVVAYNNSLGGGVEEDTKTSRMDKLGNAVAIFNIDGREFMRATAPYQDELEAYYKGR